MKPTIALVTVVRAIGAEFVRRTLRPLIFIGIATAAVLLVLGGWLTTLNLWWWVLEIVFIIGSLVFAIIAIVADVMVHSVDPSQTKAQKQAVREFVDKLQRVSENMHTPQFIIIYRIVRDVIRPRPNGFVETITRDSKTLAPDFAKLRKQF